ncbi:MAG: CPBP family intramembrane glutamic endopeptidase [Candidatus Nanopelagicales bacterium]
MAVLAAGVLVSLGDVPVGASLLVGLLAPWLVLAGWPVLATRTRGNGPVIDLGLRMTWRDVGWGLLGGLVALVLGSLAGALTVALFGEFSSAAGDVAQELADNGERAALVAFAVAVAVGAPVVEELAFRGMVFASLARRGVLPWVNVLVTAGAFALFHFEPKRILVLLVIGGVLSVLRWRTRALGASIVAHAVNNLPGALFLLTLG